jgi:hypothetical protein
LVDDAPEPKFKAGAAGLIGADGIEQ